MGYVNPRFPRGSVRSNGRTDVVGQVELSGGAV